MTEFFEAFNPGAKHLREQKDLQKVLVVQAKRGGKGPRELDLDSGRILLVRPGEQAPVDAPVLRRALPKDLERAARVCVRAHLDGGQLEHTDPYLDILRDTARRSEQAELWVLLDENKLVGTVTWCPAGSPLREIATDDEGEFRMLAVDPQAQGRGFARLMVSALIQRARDEGLSALVLSSADWMRPAHQLYRSLGFVHTPERDWSPAAGTHLQVFRLEL